MSVDLLLVDNTLRGVSAELLLGLWLHGSLGLADSGGTGNGGLTEIGSVAVLGCVAGNGLVGPVVQYHASVHVFPDFQARCRRRLLLRV